ncbi:uncharacterized protein LAJ45_04368 [Morchella importuna]|uniref:Glucosidase 2 subunit beta n=1 Tax=Morchella conica CCBAS932 TaxID=1392247 RepID=A0A3N4KJV0_9PEZI|nr:uncharacterized protein LAJ45_04368 [Morchella importuna]KAH8151746.1 hypothetical protein LAJ45_04368 [Morchella importuna]RPB08591.1 hypothetical protein P167DRAFT_528419 [Morchella conica CCBAS932]
MRQNNLLLLLTSSASVAIATAPRGVSPEDARLYAGSAFTCLTHPSITIPTSQVNDDFCDCPDGSDEPGTSACAHLPHSALAIRGFHCRNEQHTPAFLPLSRVNDGVCDYEICCDGSDEYAHVGGVSCKNRCAEIGIAARKLQAERERLRGDGVKGWAELVKKAQIMRKEAEDEVKTTEVKIEGIEGKVKGLERELRDAEEKERRRVVRAPKEGEGGKVGVLVGTAKERSEELRAGLEKVREERDAALERLKKAEGILAALKEGYNPNFNDEGVKTAVRAWEEYLAQEETSTKLNDAEERDLDDLLGEDPVDWDEFLEVDEPQSDLYNIEAYLPESIKVWVHDKLHDFRQILVENGILAPAPDTPGIESKAVNAARAALKTAESEERNNRARLTALNDDLNTAYGHNDVFRPLKGECIDADVGEYKYEFCFHGKAHQKSLKDSSSTSLGSFARIEYTTPEDVGGQHGLFDAGWEEAHEEGLSGVVLKYDNGQQCWNGPKRSVNVELYCSAVNELRSVREEEKCVYRFEVGTPAVCGDRVEDAKGESMEERVRDEL